MPNGSIPILNPLANYAVLAAGFLTFVFDLYLLFKFMEFFGSKGDGPDNVKPRCIAKYGVAGNS